MFTSQIRGGSAFFVRRLCRFEKMRTSIAQLTAFVLSLPSWILILAYLFYPVSFRDGGLHVFVIVVTCSISLAFATSLSLCAEDYSDWRLRFLLSWEAFPVLFSLVLCFAWLARNWSDISDWVFLVLMSCIYKMIVGFGHG